MNLRLKDLAKSYQTGKASGIVSVCSAHPIVLRAAMRHGLQTHFTVLIEATCNQVNQDGGYTGKQPADFVKLVKTIAIEEGLPTDQLILGGDHLGPNPWKSLHQEHAMQKASELVRSYVVAGFNKIHLDTSMGCKDEPRMISDQLSAVRTIKLLKIAETTAQETNLPPPHYVIGTEVPTPGGANHLLREVIATTSKNAKKTIDTHLNMMKNEGLSHVIPRVIGLVVQPGVEFGNHNVIYYDRKKTTELTNILENYPNLIFEAHSTDYQGEEKLSELVKDGFLILKVGPELTFSLREGIYGLDLIASELFSSYGDRPLYKQIEKLMLLEPGHWKDYYFGTDMEKRLLCHYSLSDRIRYYWSSKVAKNAVEKLFDTIQGKKIPFTLIKQFLPSETKFADIPLDPKDLLISKITKNLEVYNQACKIPLM